MNFEKKRLQQDITATVKTLGKIKRALEVPDQVDKPFIQPGSESSVYYDEDELAYLLIFEFKKDIKKEVNINARKGSKKKH